MSINRAKRLSAIVALVWIGRRWRPSDDDGALLRRCGKCIAVRRTAETERPMTTSYPRDMIGYGAEPPHAQWPGEARLALQFVINYEEGAENSILHGDPAAEAFLSEWIGAQPALGMRNMNMESLYEYGSRAGFWRLYRAFTARRLPVTVYAVAMALERN